MIRRLLRNNSFDRAALPEIKVYLVLPVVHIILFIQFILTYFQRVDQSFWPDLKLRFSSFLRVDWKLKIYSRIICALVRQILSLRDMRVVLIPTFFVYRYFGHSIQHFFHVRRCFQIDIDAII